MTNDQAPLARLQPFAIVYDGDCPFCRTYVRLLRLKESAGEIKLVDGRREPALVETLSQAGHDINCGIVVFDRGDLYSADEAMGALARRSEPSGLFNRLNVALFARPRLSRILYPAFRAGRRATLALLGKPLIG
jgi:predicted DCC family thiol-disulfide oxidoreductase YuxK